MKYDGLVFGEKWAETRVQEEHRLADARRLAREARGDRPSGLVEARSMVLCHLGTVLEQLGQKMQEQASLPEARLEPSGE
jgi:hypothetical protein